MQFLCPICQATLALPDSAAGKPAKCPACERRILAPSAAASIPGPPTQQVATATTTRNSARGTDHSIGQTASLARCPNCDRTLAFDASMAGQVAICPSCSRRMRMPSLGQGGDVPVEAMPPVAAGQSFEPKRPPDFPYGPLTGSPPTGRMRPSRPSSIYSTPGAFLLFASGVQIVIDIVWFVMVAAGIRGAANAGDDTLGWMIFLIWGMISLACHGAAAYAGHCMIARRSLSSARIGAAVGILPCGACGVLQAPIAIWALLVLARPEASSDFSE